MLTLNGDSFKVGSEIVINFPPIPGAESYIAYFDGELSKTFAGPPLKMPFPPRKNWWCGIQVFARVKNDVVIPGSTGGTCSLTFDPKFPKQFQGMINNWVKLGKIKLTGSSSGSQGGTVSNYDDVLVGCKEVRVLRERGPIPPWTIPGVKVMTANAFGSLLSDTVMPTQTAKIQGWTGGDYYFAYPLDTVKEFMKYYGTSAPLTEFGYHDAYCPHPWNPSESIYPHEDCDDYSGHFWSRIKMHLGGCAVANVAGCPSWVQYQSHAFNLIACTEGDVIKVYAVDTTAYTIEGQDIHEVIAGYPVCNVVAMIF